MHAHIHVIFNVRLGSNKFEAGSAGDHDNKRIETNNPYSRSPPQLPPPLPLHTNTLAQTQTQTWVQTQALAYTQTQT